MTTGNVLYITVDQWRGDCLGVGGHPVVKTPALDALATKGVRFANHWSVTAPCGPSRASLHTGRYLMGHRAVANGTPLDHEMDNVARIARRHGYDPTLFGYTDTSVDPRIVESLDDPRLFDYEGVLPGFTPETVLTWKNMDPWLSWLESKGHVLPSTWEGLFEPLEGYPDADKHPWHWAPSRFPAEHTETAFLTERFLEWHRRRDEAHPWFAHLSYIRPHPPYRAPEGYHDLYDPDSGPGFKRLADRDAEASRHLIHGAGAQITKAPVDEREMRQLRAAYWGNMSEVDAQLGMLFETLGERGDLEDTLIVLTSDHGDQMGDHWLVEKLGWWDESYFIPLIVVDPRRESDQTRGLAIDNFTESVDILATLCEWIGAEIPLQVDGRALQPFLHDGCAPTDWRTEAHWQWDFRDPVDHFGEDLLGLTMEQCTLDVIRGSDYKYVHFGDGDCLYFDLSADPDQLEDRSKDQASLCALADARSRLLSWRMRHDDRTLAGHKVTEAHGLVVRRDPRK
ncbi:MAG: sulfatase-like hydrolase/transferase [Acidimicrobiales bacterium]|nr:sulfatase-like hydrolase/transferase [Acidimicrobiales bacterium]